MGSQKESDITEQRNNIVHQPLHCLDIDGQAPQHPDYRIMGGALKESMFW